MDMIPLHMISYKSTWTWSHYTWYHTNLHGHDTITHDIIQIYMDMIPLHMISYKSTWTWSHYTRYHTNLHGHDTITHDIIQIYMDMLPLHMTSYKSTWTWSHYTWHHTNLHGHDGFCAYCVSQVCVAHYHNISIHNLHARKSNDPFLISCDNNIFGWEITARSNQAVLCCETTGQFEGSLLWNRMTFAKPPAKPFDV